MSKDTFYFSHDYNARNDEKILKLRAKFGNESAYGLFWFLIESMSESPDGTLDWSDSEAIAPLSLSYGVPIDRLKNFIEYAIEIGVFNISKNRFFSKRIIDHKKFRRQFSEAGKAGAKKRWKKKNSPPISLPNAKERKGKESKGNNKKHKYLDKVLLTDEEYTKLINKFGEVETKIWIKKLDDGIAIKGYPYKSHYRAILKWKENEKEKKEDSIPKGMKEFYQ